MTSTAGSLSYALARKPNEDQDTAENTKIDLSSWLDFEISEKKWMDVVPETVGNIHLPTVLMVSVIAPITTILGARLSKKLSSKSLKIALVSITSPRCFVIEICT